MGKEIKKIKILSASFVEEDVLSALKQVKGILDVKLENKSDYYVLNYVIDDWSSDYDVMVLLMDVLSNHFNLDSEPLFEEDVEFNEAESENSNLKVFDEKECYGEEEYVEFDEEAEQIKNKKNEVKYKIIEMGVSLLVIILGAILGSFSKTKEFSKYVYVIAFAVSGYEVIIDAFASVIKKTPNVEKLLVVITAFSAILVNMPSLSAVLTLIYSLLLFAFNYFQEKYGFCRENTLTKYVNVLQIAVFGILVILTFIMPIFTGVYKHELLNWAQKSTLILSIFTVSPLLLSLPFSYYFCVKNAEKNSVIIKDRNSLITLSKVNKVAFLNEEVLLEKDGEIKQNAYGAILEIYDAKISETILLSSSSKEQTSKLRKELSITRSVSLLDDSGKEAEILDFKNKDKNSIVLGVGKVLSNSDVSLAFNTESDGNEILITNGEVKNIPLSLKLAKRFRLTLLQNLIFGCSIKLILSVLIAFGVITSAVLPIILTSLLSVLAVLNAFRNNQEVI